MHSSTNVNTYRVAGLFRAMARQARHHPPPLRPHLLPASVLSSPQRSVRPSYHEMAKMYLTEANRTQWKAVARSCDELH